MDNDFSPLLFALASLKDILRQPMDEYRRDGAIQRFEYTFELSWKYMQRLLKEQGVEAGSPQQVLRAAFKANFIEDLPAWLSFLKNRNLSAHTYNQKVAATVFEAAKTFSPFVERLIEKLKEGASVSDR